jgi:phage tail-like protein
LGKGDLFQWYMTCMNESFVRRSVTVAVLDAQRQPVMGWHLQEAYPVKWEGPQLQSEANHIAIQTLVLACGQIEFAQ